ncbi:coil containing protein [Vibrio phage 1.081.O._10N.286.52.C2]|nr:coil containing protein [Vibrio phage 1.081.O._10N.286.52.C2]
MFLTTMLVVALAAIAYERYQAHLKYKRLVETVFDLRHELRDANERCIEYIRAQVTHDAEQAEWLEQAAQANDEINALTEALNESEKLIRKLEHELDREPNTNEY